MEKNEVHEKVEQFAKDYLTSKNVDFIAKNKRDKCRLIIDESNGLFYVESNSSFYAKTLHPGDKGHPAQAEGLSCPTYQGNPSYRFVFDSNYNIIVDLEEISDYWCINSNNKKIFLDDQNILLPKINKNREFVRFLNDFQHFKIQNGKAELIDTFESQPQITSRLKQNKLMVVDGQLYNFEEGIFLGPKFDAIFSGNDYGLEELAKNWGIPHGNYSINNRKDEFVERITQKMIENNLFGGFTKVEVKKADVSFEYHTLVFLDPKGNFTSKLYYAEETDFLATHISLETFPLALQMLYEKADYEVEKKVTEKQKEEKVFDKIKQKIF